MQLPTFSPYPRPKHPNPLTPEQVEADIAHAKSVNKRAVYQMWESERAAEVIIGSCVYGFPSCVIVDFSIGSGVQSESWNSYGSNHNQVNHAQDYLDMFAWLATKITERATGSQFGVGEFSEITIVYQ